MPKPKPKPKTVAVRVKEKKGKSSIQHKCALCPFSTRILQRYEAHTKTHPSQVRPFPCPHPGCSYAAKEKRYLTQHSKTHSAEKSLFCSHPNCNYSTNNKTSFTGHTRIHTGEKPFACQFQSCSYTTAKSGELVTHSRTHTKERPYKCPEPNCEYAAATSGHLKSHRLTHPPKEGEERPSFKCPLCDYSTTVKRYLTSHAKSHTLEKNFKCDEPNCTFESRTKAAVANHKQVHYNNEQELEKHSYQLFDCPVESCEFSSPVKAYLSVHLKTHSEERRFKCELCPFRGKARETVTKHIKQVHSDLRPFKCPEPKCDYAAKINGNLNIHLLSHQREKKYSCPFPDCDYKAGFKDMIKKHKQNLHQLERKFKCGLCDFSCTTRAGLVSHTRTHIKEKQYKSRVQRI